MTIGAGVNLPVVSLQLMGFFTKLGHTTAQTTSSSWDPPVIWDGPSTSPHQDVTLICMILFIILVLLIPLLSHRIVSGYPMSHEYPMKIPWIFLFFQFVPYFPIHWSLIIILNLHPWLQRMSSKAYVLSTMYQQGQGLPVAWLGHAIEMCNGANPIINRELGDNHWIIVGESLDTPRIMRDSFGMITA